MLPLFDKANVARLYLVSSGDVLPGEIFSGSMASKRKISLQGLGVSFNGKRVAV